MNDGKDMPPWFQPFRMDGNLGEFGAAHGKMVGAWMKAWQAMVTGRALPAMGLMFQPPAGDAGREVLEALESWLGTPQWSDFASLDSDTLKRFAPAMELVQVSQAYALATARVCAEICAEFQRRLAASSVKLDGSGEALDLWNSTVDEVLMQFNRSDSFAELQRRFLRAMMAYKLEQRWVLRRICDHYDLPSRDEIDELTRRVHELGREHRQLRRTLAAQKRDAAERSRT